MWINGHVAGWDVFSRWMDATLDAPLVKEPPVAKPQRRTPSAPPVALLGIPFDSVTLVSALSRIERMIKSGDPHYVVTANVDFLVQARADAELRHVLQQADLVLCDGTPLLWFSRMFGNSLPERVAGSDLTPLLIQRAAEKGYRIFFLGGQQDVADQAVERLRKQFPNLIIAGQYSPPFKPLAEMDHEDIARRIRAARPDIVFVSFGCPKAEKWMAMHYKSLGVPVMIGVGATIDFLAGRVKRAPGWMQRSGTEWLYRLCCEPRRLYKRYARDLWVFGWAIARQIWHFHPRRDSGARLGRAKSSVISEHPDHVELRLPPRFDKRAVCRDADRWPKIRGQHCLVQLRDVQFIDSTGLAFLLQLQRRLRAEGFEMILVAPRPHVARAIHAMRVDSFLQITSELVEARQTIHASEKEESHPVIESATDWPLPLTWQGDISEAFLRRSGVRTREHLQPILHTNQRSRDAPQ